MARIWVGTIIALALIAGACSSGDIDDASGEGQQVRNPNSDGFVSVSTDDEDIESEIPSVPGAPLNRFDLQIGQCFNEGSWYDENLDRRVDLTASIDCEAEHQNEVYHAAEFPAPNGAPFPGEDKMTEWSTQLCYDAFEGFIDQEYEESLYQIGFVQPTRDTFEHPVGRHRRVFCYVYDLGGDWLAGTARGSGL